MKTTFEINVHTFIFRLDTLGTCLHTFMIPTDMQISVRPLQLIPTHACTLGAWDVACDVVFVYL